MKSVGTNERILVIDTVKYVLWFDFINSAIRSFVVQIMDFSGILVQNILISIEWRIKSAHTILLSYVLGYASTLYAQYKRNEGKCKH